MEIWTGPPGPDPVEGRRMYSKEERARILAEIDASGMSVAAWCRRPGTPNRNAVRAWVAAGQGFREPEVRGRAEGHEKHRPYPEATRREAVRLVRQGMSPGDAARRLRVPIASVYAWRDAASGRVPVRGDGKGAVRMGAAERIAELERELEERDRQIAVLRELMRDPKSGDPASLSNARKSELGERLRRERGWSLAEVLRCLRISKSSYFYALGAAGRRREREAEVDGRVLGAWEASGGAYGYRKVRAALAAGRCGDPIALSEAEVRRSMRRQGISGGGAAAEPPRYSSYAGELSARPANAPRERALARREAGEDFRLAHDFSAGAPGELLVTDVSEFAVGGSKVYLSPVIDMFDGMPLGWSVSGSPDSALVGASLAQALGSLPEGSRPTVHTDGGAVYMSRAWREAVEAAGGTRSMSRKGTCPDNAPAEGFFGRLKREMYHGRDWSRASPEDLAGAIDAYIRWYRSGRLRAFREGGRTVYDTIEGRRRRLGLAV